MLAYFVSRKICPNLFDSYDFGQRLFYVLVNSLHNSNAGIMKKKIVLILLVFAISSCTKEGLECLVERDNLKEQYDYLIEEASSNPLEQERLRKEKKWRLENMDCLIWEL